MDTFYTERSGGRNVYWTYVDGKAHYVSQQLVERAIARKHGKLVRVR